MDLMGFFVSWISWRSFSVFLVDWSPFFFQAKKKSEPTKQIDPNNQPTNAGGQDPWDSDFAVSWAAILTTRHGSAWWIFADEHVTVKNGADICTYFRIYYSYLRIYLVKINHSCIIGNYAIWPHPFGKVCFNYLIVSYVPGSKLDKLIPPFIGRSLQWV